jgi:hypothetical protein
LLNHVSWLTQCGFPHCPVFEFFHFSQCQDFHSRQIIEHTHGLPKTWCTLSQRDWSGTHPKQVEWCVPRVVCGCSREANWFRRPQVLISVSEWSSKIRKHYLGKFYGKGHR